MKINKFNTVSVSGDRTGKKIHAFLADKFLSLEEKRAIDKMTEKQFFEMIENNKWVLKEYKEKGIYIGSEINNKHKPVVKFNKSNRNENAFIMGSVGQGMSFHVTDQMLQQFTNDNNIIITDPKSEF